MEKFVISGGNRLQGEVNISGAKNAAVAIIPATILAEGKCVLENVPGIRDVNVYIRILKQMGAEVRMIDKSTLEIDTTHVHEQEISYDMTKHLRASYYLMGSMLGRFGRADVSLPGGCDFGVRPIDQHIKGFEALGAEVDMSHGMVSIRTPEELLGNQIYFDVVSVGATMNTMLAAVRGNGLTVIENAAKEPHIVDLANFLNSMGADIMGAGTDVIKIKGVQEMHGTTYSIIPDQIEAGTYMVAAAATRGNVLVKNVIPKHLEPITDKLRAIGVHIDEFDDSVHVWADPTDVFQKVNVKTMPHPGFPTDMQPQMATLLTTIEGTSIVAEGVWNNRFKYTDELCRMGANVQVDGKMAVIEGVECLNGAPVKASDLRAGAALMIAGLMATGETSIEEIKHIERGYEDMMGKLQNLGADIRKVYTPGPEMLEQAL